MTAVSVVSDHLTRDRTSSSAALGTIPPRHTALAHSLSASAQVHEPPRNWGTEDAGMYFNRVGRKFWPRISILSVVLGGKEEGGRRMRNEG
jgi:hypothetical protein